MHRLDKNGHLVAVTNIPWSVIEHSSSGFEWGFGGSGPSDMALNILNAFVPPGSDGKRKIQCSIGEASNFAFKYHHNFKNDMIVRVPGGPV